MIARRACCLALLSWVPFAVAKRSPAEQARIERLIEAVASQRDCKFIRNGNEYSAANAAKFLREKLNAYGDKVMTAGDFIEQIASRSSTSGIVYKVRLADGRELPSAEFLRAELARLDAAAAR